MRYLLFLSLLCLAACAPDQKDVNVRLTMAERERVDKRVTVYMDSLRPILKKQCEDTFEDRVAVMTDSIVQRRLEEEARLRARIPQNPRQ